MSSLSNLKRQRERLCNTKGSSNQYMDQITCTYMKRVAQSDKPKDNYHRTPWGILASFNTLFWFCSLQLNGSVSLLASAAVFSEKFLMDQLYVTCTTADSQR